MSADLQAQARALGDPTRHEIFRYVAEADRRVDVAELTAHLGLNHNAVRQHLAKLRHAELLDEATAPPAGRGRPRLTYGVHPAAGSRWGVVGPYERLSLLLAEAVRTGATPEEIGRRSVDELGARPAAADPVDDVAAAMASQGFDPVVRRRGEEAEVVLRACPFASAAVADPATICGIHLGMAEGLAERSGGRMVVDELVPHDPRRAGCRLRLHLVAEGEAPDADDTVLVDPPAPAG